MMEKRRQGTAEFPMHPGIDEEREKSAERGMMTAEQFYNLTPKFWDEHRRGGNYKSDWELRFEFADAHAAAQLAEKERELAELRQANASAGIHAIRYQGLAEAAEQRLQEAQAEIKRIHKLFGDLTPGGSEFAGDPDYCAKYLRDRANTQTDLLKKKFIELRQREAELDELRTIAEKASAYCTICDDWRGAVGGKFCW